MATEYRFGIQPKVLALQGITERMKMRYQVCSPGGTVLARFGHLTMARYFARRNMPCIIQNAKSGKQIPIN
jgi:hypothetical protein